MEHPQTAAAPPSEGQEAGPSKAFPADFRVGSEGGGGRVPKAGKRFLFWGGILQMHSAGVLPSKPVCA